MKTKAESLESNPSQCKYYYRYYLRKKTEPYDR